MPCRIQYTGPIVQPIPFRSEGEERSRYAVILGGEWDIVWDGVDPASEEYSAFDQGHQVRRPRATAESSTLTSNDPQVKTGHTASPPGLGAQPATHFAAKYLMFVSVSVISPPPPSSKTHGLRKPLRAPTDTRHLGKTSSQDRPPPDWPPFNIPMPAPEW